MNTLLSKCCAISITAFWTTFVGSGSASANEAIPLKISKDLSSMSMRNATQIAAQSDQHGLLGRIPLLRGVAVSDESFHLSNSSNIKTNVEHPKESRRPMVNAVYGGLQIALQENLSLIYAPGRLAGNAINSESQGLYLLANRGGLANWFMGVESRSYSNASDSRRTANSAQFGVIVDLD